MIDNFFAWLLSLSKAQLFGLILGIIVFFVVVSLVKKVFKIILLSIAVIGALIYFGFVIPEDIKKSAEILADSVKQEEVISLSVVSDKVRITNGVIEFCIDGEWYCFDDVTRLRMNSDGVYLLEVEDSEIKVNDADVQKLLDTIMDK